MRKKGLPAAAVIIVAAGLVMAGAAARPAPSADLSPSVPTGLPLAIQSLITTGVLPADVSSEPGVWNFAGPATACPGPGWVCTTPGVFGVVQKGTVNVLQATTPEQACPSPVEQQGLVNIMECKAEEKESPVAHQICGPVTQEPEPTSTEAYNTLICKLYYDVQTSEVATVDSQPVSTQCVLQEAHFDQSGTTNEFKGELRVVQQQVSGSAQRQQARQRINGFQDAEEWNKSEVEETQIQKLSGNARLQFQNDEEGCPGVAEPVTGLREDCNDLSSEGPANPYTCLELDQDVCCEADSKNENISKLKQEVRQDAFTTAVGSAAPPAGSGPVTQQQGESTGGNDGDIDQELPFGSTGRNLDIAHQYTYQKLVAPGTDVFTEQIQIEDPFCCAGSQSNGEGNEETADMTVLQEAHGDPTPRQEAEARGIVSSSPQEEGFLLLQENGAGSCFVKVNHHIDNSSGSADTSRTDAGSTCSIDSETSCTTVGNVPGTPGCISDNCPPEKPFNPDSGRCEEPGPSEVTTTSGFAPLRSGGPGS